MNSTLSHIDARSGFVKPRKSIEPVWIGGRRLKYVHAVWKHGDRAPKLLPYPEDKYDLTYWPRGWGQITNLGMRQMRDLGHYFRTIYADQFISSEYDRDEVIVKSSSDSRALTAAQVFLYGLFPPMEDHEFFDHTLNWQPIPVHSYGTEESDVMLRPTGFICPAYENIKEKIMTTVEMDLLTKYADLVEFLRPIIYLGIKNPPKLRLRDITKLVDIQREIVHNFTQPNWVRKRWPQYARKSTLDIVFEMRLIERNAESSNPSLAYLAGGLLLGDWLERLQSIGRGESVRPSKMMLYSAHDATLVSLLYLLQANWDGYKVPYASCLTLELYEVENGYVVELFFRRAGLNEQLTVKGCIRSCPLDKFLNLLRASAIYNTAALNRDCSLTQHATGGGLSVTVITQTLDNLNEDPIVALLSDQQDTYETNRSTNIYQDVAVNKSLAEMEILTEEAEDRNALMRNDTRRWRMIDPNDGRVIIPYNITGNFTDKDVEVIRHSMDILENNTCMKYVSLDDQLLSNDIYDGYSADIKNDKSGCHAGVGRGKKSTVNLGPGCVAEYMVLHELLHDIGLHHEQQRPDSEEYILVHYSNIEPAYRFAFEPKSDLTTYGYPYDCTNSN